MNNQDSNKLVDDARLLLPWYLTDKLSKAEQNLVNRALEASPELRQEFLQEEKMMRLVRENTSLLALSAMDTTAQRLNKLLSRIDREEGVHTTSEKSSVTAVQHSKLKSSIKSNNKPWYKQRFKIEWLMPANAVFASLLLAQLALLSFYLTQPMQTEMAEIDFDNYQSEVDFQTANSPNKAVSAQGDQFLVAFKPEVAYQTVCDLLKQHDMRIVNGPAENHNIFTVEVHSVSKEDKASLVAMMRANPAILFWGSNDVITESESQQ